MIANDVQFNHIIQYKILQWSTELISINIDRYRTNYIDNRIDKIYNDDIPSECQSKFVKIDMINRKIFFDINLMSCDIKSKNGRSS